MHKYNKLTWHGTWDKAPWQCVAAYSNQTLQYNRVISITDTVVELKHQQCYVRIIKQ